MRFTVPFTGHRVEVLPAAKPHVFKFPDDPEMQALVDTAVRLGVSRDFYRLNRKKVKALIELAAVNGPGSYHDKVF
jgi:hypothetical protein